MTARGRGQIAFVSSLAAYAPLPSSPGYSASKAAVLVYGLALRERVRERGVRVSVICPGYIDTAMGERYGGWRPLAMSAETAAARIVAGLARDRPVIAFPRRLALAARLSTLVPEGARRLGLSAFRFSIKDGA
jgi:short-subunit dehydrogenase